MASKRALDCDINNYQPVQTSDILKDGQSSIIVNFDKHMESLAVALSDYSGVVLNAESLQKLTCCNLHYDRIMKLKFFPESSNIIASCSLDGSIKLWDIRSNKIEKKFSASSNMKNRFTSFDISSNDRILCAGTELTGEDSYILFWDIRGSEFLGGYWNSHFDDVVSVNFNPNQEDILLSAGTDGLINIFDISKRSESEAFTYCINIDIPLHLISWKYDRNKTQQFLSVSANYTVDYWNIEGTSPIYHFTRKDISHACDLDSDEDCFVMSLHICKDICAYFLIECICDNAKHFKVLELNTKTGKLSLYGNFSSYENIADIIDIVYSDVYDTFITAADDCTVSLWKKDIDKNICQNKYVKRK